VTSTDVAPKFFIDQCVPDSVGAAFGDRGHEVMLLRQHLAIDISDELVAALAEHEAAILVTLDKDFNEIAKRFGVGRRRFKTLSRIRLACKESRARERVSVAMSLIEHEWRLCQESTDRRLFLEIGDSYIRTNR